MKSKSVGVDDVEGPPVPIPNTEVKLNSAEDTWRVTAWESNRPIGRLFFCVNVVAFSTKGCYKVVIIVKTQEFWWYCAAFSEMVEQEGGF